MYQSETLFFLSDFVWVYAYLICGTPCARAGVNHVVRENQNPNKKNQTRKQTHAQKYSHTHKHNRARKHTHEHSHSDSQEHKDTHDHSRNQKQRQKTTTNTQAPTTANTSATTTTSRHLCVASMEGPRDRYSLWLLGGINQLEESQIEAQYST